MPISPDMAVRMVVPHDEEVFGVVVGWVAGWFGGSVGAFVGGTSVISAYPCCRWREQCAQEAPYTTKPTVAMITDWNDTPNYKRGSVKRFTHADVGQASIGDRRTSGDCVPVGPGELSDDFETCERIRTMQRNA
jgi:hypothetical protein